MQAIYLHIPFCQHICHYCDFNKVFLKGQPVEQYLYWMREELKNTLNKYPANLKTIFVGGGTPTVLTEKQLEYFLESILLYINPNPETIEYTFEANPGELSKQKLQLLLDSGVNRLSFGVQTFNDELLKAIGRTHRKEDVMNTLNLARSVGFENISFDLMYGLPNQTISEVEETLNIAFSLNLPHFSAYSLIIEPKTVFYNLQRKGKLRLPSEDKEAKMYEIIMNQMEENGYVQYEISNFSKAGYESKHNLTYWNNEEYFGIGAGAHSYVKGVRIVNYGPIKKYMSEIRETGMAIFDKHSVTKQEKMEEELFLGLRKTDGISISHFHKKFGEELFSVFGKQIDQQIAAGLMEKREGRIQLTRAGKLLGNEVFQAFINVI